MLIFRGLRVSETVKTLGQRYQYWLRKADILPDMFNHNNLIKHFIAPVLCNNCTADTFPFKLAADSVPFQLCHSSSILESSKKITQEI